MPTTTLTINKLLIANRGEIALRVMRTAHALGISTVAVFSDADADMPFVRAADEAIGLGGAAARESYLVIDKIIAAAKATGADAIHPGYGFLSENPLFAEACAAAGIIFVGPSADTIRKLGAKREAKQLATAAGVPTVPGYNGEDQATEAFVREADKLGYPLLLKASAGGGGKGMHVLRGGEDVAEAVERAKREALAAFGDGTLLMERYLERPRHIEVQILGDRHGNLVHLYERECSIQRRHQKILEEAPSPTLAGERRARMGEAAVALGRAVGYVGAGTVEFIVDASGAFYFLEVNTRLQVEHPVTELVCGVDLVAEQLRVARGEKLRWSEAPPRRGHAIEVRLCAEDPDRDYLPTTGQVVELSIAPELSGAPVRCDLGVEAGSEIGIHYDSMLGKLIAHADTREEAAGALRRALQQGLIAGVTTNADLLVRLLGHPAFLAGELDTHFLERHAASLRPASSEVDAAVLEAALAATLAGLAERSDRRAGSGPADAQAQLACVPLGWHNVAAAPTVVRFHSGGAAGQGAKPVEVRYQLRPERDGGGAVISIGEQRQVATKMRLVQLGSGVAVEAELELAPSSENGDGSSSIGLARHRRRWRVAHRDDRFWIGARGQTVALVEEPRFPERVAAVAAGSLLAPMPGKVVKVLVAAGDQVKAGAPIVILEAMKMEHTIRAAADGAVGELRVAVGDQVAADEVLAVVA